MSEKQIKQPSKGRLFVISAPAGTGKTTLVKMLTDEFPNVVRAVTCTTRSPRLGEKEGQDYFFLTEQEFKKKLAEGDFLEHANVFGFNYGTSRSVIEEKLKSGKQVIVVIDTQGALQLKKKLKAVFIFISPPSLSELKKRLEKRGTESPASIEKRLQWAQRELEMISHYDYHLINDNLMKTYEALKNILCAFQ